MRNLFIVIINIIFFIHVLGMQCHEGQQYVCLRERVYDVPQLLEFFSFYCPHCYQFEEIYHISSNINKTLPKGVRIVKYHVDFLGRLGRELTQAWSVAVILGIEDKISSLMFYELHNKKSIRTVEDIRLVFTKFGISCEEYDLVLNGMQVQEFLLKQKKAVFEFKLHGVPVIFINGRYMIKNDGLDTSSMDSYIKQCSEIINILMIKM